jgi:CRP-like cAMP-binding protein
VASSHRAPPNNGLLEFLPADDLLRVLAGCDSIGFLSGDLLHDPARHVEHVYFPTSGFISLIMPIDHVGAVEVALVGDEGMFGIPLALGVNVSPLRAVAQGAGTALRMGAASFRRELGRSRAFEQQIDHYIFVHLQQLAQATACTRFHVVEERLARWLLMTQDRAHSDTFHLTHECLASMLGVRRAGVTRAAGSFQRRNLIHYSRGDITVVDRRGLEATSCACYAVDRRSHRRFLGRR